MFRNSARLTDGFRHGFAGRAATLMTGILLGQAVAIAASPVITRLFEPDELGEYQVYLAIVAILGAVAALKYEMAIPLPEDDETAADVTLLGLGITSIGAVALGVVVWLFRNPVSSAIGVPGLSDLLWLAPFSFLAWGWYRVYTFWALRTRTIKRLAQTRFTQAAGMAAGQVGFGAAGVGSIGLPLGDVAGRTAATLILRRGFHRRPGKRRLDLGRIRDVAGRYRRFPLFTANAQLLVAAGRQLPPVLVAGFFGPVSAGFFALSDRVGGAPAQFAGEAVGQAFVAEIGPLVETDPHRIEAIFLRLAARLSALALLAIAPLLAAPWLFEVVFGSKWRTAGEFARSLAILFAARFVVIPLGQTLPLLGYQHWHLSWAIGRSIGVLGAMAAAGWAGYSVEATVLVYSVTATAFFAGLFVLSLTGVRRFVQAFESNPPSTE